MTSSDHYLPPPGSRQTARGTHTTNAYRVLYRPPSLQSGWHFWAGWAGRTYSTLPGPHRHGAKGGQGSGDGGKEGGGGLRVLASLGVQGVGGAGGVCVCVCVCVVCVGGGGGGGEGGEWASQCNPRHRNLCQRFSFCRLWYSLCFCPVILQPRRWANDWRGHDLIGTPQQQADIALNHCCPSFNWQPSGTNTAEQPQFVRQVLNQTAETYLNLPGDCG